MSSKAQRRRNKKAAKALPQLAPIEKKEQHRVGGRFARDEDPRKTVAEARQRQAGKSITREDAMDPLLGCEMGRVIHFYYERPAASRLWDTWQAYCGAERTYRMLKIGATGDPQGAAIQMVPEPMQTDQSLRVDMRDEEQRLRDAVSNYMRWQGFLGMLLVRGRAGALRQAERGIGKPLWQEGSPTQAGLFAVQALNELAEVSR